MDLSTLLECHRRLDEMGTSVFKQFVDVVQAGDSESIEELEQDGQLNLNAAVVMQRVLTDMIRDLEDEDDELKEELKELRTEIDVYLKEKE